MSWSRALAKRLAEAAFGSDIAVRVGLARHRDERLILSYHNVVAEETPPRHGDRSLHLPLERFREQLDVLTELGIPVLPLCGASLPHASAPPHVVITFDDAYAGALTLAVPELANRSMPATIFVAPGLLGAAAPWWDQLASPNEGAVPEQIRLDALERFRGEGAEILAHAAAEGWERGLCSPEHRIANEDELRLAVAGHGGLTVGTHTWSHPNLEALARGSEEAALRQLTETAYWLQTRFDNRAVPYVAYPYGLESPAVRRIASAAGLAGGLRVSGGWDNLRGDPFGIPRLNVTPGLSRNGFRARVAALTARG